MITREKLDETVRSIIRQRVRSHFGLISEAQTLSDRDVYVELTVTMGDDPTGDIVTIKNASRSEVLKSFTMFVPTVDRVGNIGSEVEQYILTYPIDDDPKNPVLPAGKAWYYKNGDNETTFDLPAGKPIYFAYELVSGAATEPLILQAFPERASPVTQTAVPPDAGAGSGAGDAAAGTASASSASGASEVTPTTTTPPVPDPQAAAPSAADTGAGGGAVAPASPPTTGGREPQSQASTAGMSLQDKIKNVAKAVQRDFADVEKEGVITLQQVEAENGEQGHEWIDVGGADKYGLSDWASRAGDPYTYFALVNTETKEPVAFVVASDPIDNDHYSTGRFIGPDSKRGNLRTAFCKLYHRATGRVHESCEDGASSGSEDDRLAGSGSKGKGGVKGSRKSGSRDDAGGGTGDTRVPADIRQMGGTVTGSGDVKNTRFIGIPVLDPYEKARKGGKKIVTKSMNEHGFKGFPIKKKGKSPRSIAVFFDTSVMLKSGSEPHTTRVSLEELNADSIVKIKFGFIGPPKGLYWGRGHVVKPGDKYFDEAAKWVFNNPEQFNLLSDNDEDEADEHAAEDREVAAKDGSNKKGPASKAHSTGRREGSINEARRTLSLTPLFDRYRF